jgi:hypothetical protein
MQSTPPKKSPLSAFDLISACRNTRQASVFLREVTRLHCEETLKKIRALPPTGIHKTNSQP